MFGKRGPLGGSLASIKRGSLDFVNGFDPPRLHQDSKRLTTTLLVVVSLFPVFDSNRE
jgi:hypothetical protein